jgi:hypothetical protein
MKPVLPTIRIRALDRPRARDMKGIAGGHFQPRVRYIVATKMFHEPATRAIADSVSGKAGLHPARKLCQGAYMTHGAGGVMLLAPDHGPGADSPLA